VKLAAKAALFSVSLAAAGLCVWSAAAHLSPVSAGSVTGSLPEPAAKAPAAQAQPATEAPQAAPERAAPAEEAIEVPKDLQISVRATPKGRTLVVRRKGHLVTVRAGHDRKTGMHEATWPAGGAAKLVWETTDTKTLETTRGELAWDGSGEAPAARSAAVLRAVSREAKGAHACQAYGDGATGFVAVCRVDGQAAAASVESKDPREGVWALGGPTTLVRLDLPMEGEGVDTKVIGYEKASGGVLVRVEASRAAGEKAALLAIGSDSRAQPRPIRRPCCICRFPVDVDRL
jgi:hypothetical protein